MCALKRKITNFPDIYLTILDATQIRSILFINKNAKQKTVELGSLSKSEKKVELNILSFRRRAAYGSVPNLGKASGLSKKTLEHFLQTQSSYKKFAPSINCFRRLQASSKHIMEVLYHGISFYGQTSESKQLSELFVGYCWCVLAICQSSNMETKIAEYTLQAFKKVF